MKWTKEQQIKNCGARLKSRGANGNKEYIKYKCGYWRECPKCAKEHAGNYKNEVVILARRFSEKLYLIINNNNAYLKNLTRRLSSHHHSYFSFRTDEKTYVFHTDENEGGIKVDLEYIDGLDWLQITNTKRGSRISSNIHKLSFDKKELVEFKIALTKTNAPDDIDDDMWTQARIEAGNPNPKTIEQAQEALFEVNKRYIDIIQRNGYNVIFSLISKRYIIRKEITWEPIPQIQIPTMVNANL